MLQQCSSVSSCMQTHVVMEEHYTVCQHFMPFVLNGLMQLFLVFRNTKHGRVHRLQTSLTQAYKNLFPDTTNASIPVVTMLISSLCMYVFFVYNKKCFSCCLFC
jgi:hypothetical protein